MNNASKIVLGTVQFGCQYGINSAGRPNEDEVRHILQKAADAGIAKLDTSSAYGDSESVLGNCIPADANFRIISKYPKSDVSVREMFVGSLERLKVKKLYGYLLHHFEVYRNNNAVWNEFLALKQEGLVEKIGFSLYTTDELELLLQNDVPFDLLQVPYNIFDRQFEPYVPILKGRGVEIHVRSTFLQGLFFMNREALPDKLQPLKPYLLQLDEYAQSMKMSVAEVALNHNLQNPAIDGVLIGVDNQSQLMSNLRSIRNEQIEWKIDIKEKGLLSPVNWK